MKILIGKGRKATFPKKFCEDNNIKYGDEFNLSFKDSVIILTPINSEIGSEDDKICKNKNVKMLDLQTISQIPLNNESEFKPNLLESINFKKHYYSECGLLCRTKPQYLVSYCNRCKGQMIAKEFRKKYCPYAEDVTSCNSQSLNNIVLKDIIVNKPNNIKDDTKNIVKSIHNNVTMLDENLNTNLNTLNCNKKLLIKGVKGLKKEVNKVYEDVIDNKDVVNIMNDKTTLEYVNYKHHHQCYSCEEYYLTGFTVGIEETHFYCKNCAKILFKNYLEKRGKYKNV